MSLLSFFRKKISPKHVVILFDMPYCKIYFHSDIQAIHLDWDGQATSTQFRDACNFSLDVLMEKKVRKMIADNSKVITVSVENQNWLVEDWFPRAVEEGFQYSAVIQSHQETVKSALQLIVSKISNKLVIVQNFNDLSSAKEWLKKIK